MQNNPLVVKSDDRDYQLRRNEFDEYPGDTMNAPLFFTHCRPFRELNLYLVAQWRCTQWFHGAPPPSLSICFRFIVSRSFYTRSQIRILFSSFLFFFEKRGWRKWMKTDLIMMILIMMILIRRGGPGKSNANNNHLLSAVECIFGLFDAIIILLPTITNKP